MPAGMSYILAAESFDSLVSAWTDLRRHLSWDSVFVLPWWLEAWWREFGAGAGEHLCAVRQGGDIIGIAPLLVREGRAYFIGGADVCDYLDFIVAPGKESDFFAVLLDNLRQEGIDELCLESLRPDSSVLATLVELAGGRGYEVSCVFEDVSLELELPSSWEEYLEMLSGKQRHETRRKLRRLWEAGDVNHRIVEDAGDVGDAMNVFLKLFGDRREDKATFMTAQMESFFRSLAETMAGAGFLRLGILELDALPVAAALCFDYDHKVYLYNSGYDSEYSSLSVGLISKVLCIKDSIHRGRKRFDFLKGGEVYKYRLGGKEVPIYSCRIVLK
ncbi:GNAT family N-acetyltransferase [Chloroflexota bacterium]